MERAEHVRWAKTRALEYLDQGDLGQALASMVSDLGKHPETESLGGMLAPLGMFEVMRGDAEGLRRWVTGFAE